MPLAPGRPPAHFSSGACCYHEPFGRAQATSFVPIWIGLAIFIFDSLRRRRRYR